MKKHNILIIISLFAFVNLFSQQFEIYKLGEHNFKTAENLYFYTLPKTTILFKVTTSRITTINGPYFAYAEEFLGILNVPSESTTEWQIDSIDISTFNEADPDNWYVIKAKKVFQPELLLNFTNEGLIFNPENNSQKLCPEMLISKGPEKEKSFNEITHTNFYKETNDTVYKVILKDSAFIRIPIIHSRIETKSTKEKAREAADLIMKIRQQRIDNVLSEESELPDPEAFKTNLKELDKIEKNYMSLFVGKKIKEKYTSYYMFAPPANSKETQFEIFRFSNKTGIADKTNPISTPVYLTFEKAGTTQNLDEYYKTLQAPVENHLFYRIPEKATVFVNIKGNILASKRILVSQFGTIISCPAESVKK